MKKTGFHVILCTLFLVSLSMSLFSQNLRKTTVTIRENQFLINGRLTYEGRVWEGHRIEGLLLNSRMVQGIFDDLNPKTRGSFAYPDSKRWDADRNSQEFVRAMDEWHKNGLLAFTLNLQGGSPFGYGNNGCINSAFDPKGNLRAEYLTRLEKILNKADDLGMVAILGYFYFGQDQHLDNEDAVIHATDAITQWIIDRNYRNVLIEINNECDINYHHQILKPGRVTELMARVQHKSEQEHYPLYVSTSLSGGKKPPSSVIQLSDYVLLHGNGLSESGKIFRLIDSVRLDPAYRGQPIVFNEDDHYSFDSDTCNFITAIKNYVSWGYFDYRRKNEGFENGYQSVPVDWGINSDRKKMFFKKLKEITGK